MTGLTFSDKLRSVPLLRALVPLIAGIVAGSFFGLPVYVWVVSTAVCAVTAWFARINHPVRFTSTTPREGNHHPAGRTGRHPSAVGELISTLCIALAILFFGAALTVAHSPRPVIPQGERVWMEVRITDTPTYHGTGSAHTSAAAGRWRTEDGEWRPAGEKLILSFDTMYLFSVGDRVVFRGYVNPVSDMPGSFSRLMHARGYTGRTHISQYSHPAVAPAKARGFTTTLRRFRSGASARLHRLKMSANEMAVAAAMTTGDRGGITPELRRAYSRTGASHLLAVSGLHVGIVFLLVNALLYLLPLVRRGHIVKNIVAVAVIWVYAAMTGFSPSVIRAAVMFTGAQTALAMSATRSGVNIMAGTAFVMLAVNPGWLFDISFQLSFIAVAGIMAWFGPLYRFVASRWKVLNALWGVLIVSFAASLATMPLVSHTFGVFSPAGIVLNPVIILTAHLVVMFSLAWIIAPVPFLAPVFRWLVGLPAWLQNRTVALTAAVPNAAVEYTLPPGWLFAVYAAMIIFTVWLATRPAKETPFVLPR